MPKFDVQFRVSYTDTVSVEAKNKAEAKRLLEERLRETTRLQLPILKESAIATVDLYLDKHDESTLKIEVVEVD